MNLQVLHQNLAQETCAVFLAVFFGWSN